ncbi:MAG: tetratricopeptide repeat protein [Chloroflexota bacterium]
MLSFTLLGQVALYNDGRQLTQFRSQKEVALLIYLAQTGQTHSRESIADLLWDSRTTKQALSNLRTVLTRLRKQVDDELVVTRKSLALTPESLQQVDSVRLLEKLARIGKVDTVEKADTLREVLDTYHGDFLADFHLPDTPRFDAWLIETREQICRQVIAAYDKLAQYTLSTGDMEAGIAITRRWLAVDGLDEKAHMLLIQLMIEEGHVRDAVAHYANCVERLRSELDIGPPPEMTALIETVRPTPPHIKQTAIKPPTVAQPQTFQHPLIDTTIPNHTLFNQPATTTHHNLPASYNQFFGRVAAQQDIHERLDQPWCRLLTIVGQGGVGKTRLAITVARHCLEQDQGQQYRDGIWMVELADIDTDDDDLAEEIAVEIATALDLRLTGTERLTKQVCAYLRNKQMLLVLDNFEHVLEGAVPFILDILKSTQHVQLIITSREALRIQAEWTITLTGLGYVTDASEISAVDSQSDAVDLFMARRAQQQREGISLDERTAIGRICRMVEGLPLAIELAAALTGDVTAEEIAAQMDDGLDGLTTSLRDVPERHRSLQIVFEMSWRTLTPGLQQRLARLSVFRGGFTVMAAEQIAAANAQDLAVLADKSLLSRNGNRYSLHAVVSAFAAEKRTSADQTRHNHADFYLTMLAKHTDALQKSTPQQAMAEIEADIANVRMAWQTGLAERQANWLFAALTSFSIYYQLRGLAREGESIMHTTLDRATIWGRDGLALATRSTLEQARFQIRLGRYQPAIQTIGMALYSAKQSPDRWAEGMGHVLWGEALWRLGDYDLAAAKLIHALDVAHSPTIANTAGSTLLIGWCHHHLGIIYDIQSRYDAAYDHLEQACIAWQAIDNAQALIGTLNSTGLVCYHQGDFPAAQQTMEQALTLCTQLDNRHVMSVVLNNLSIISTEQGNHLGAHHYLQSGLELATTSGNLTSQGEIYNNIGRNYLLMGKTELAAESLAQGLQVSESIGNRAYAVMAMMNLAETARAQNDITGAVAWYNQALNIAQQNNLRSRECEALIGLAELWYKSDEKAARQYIVEAVTLARAIQNLQLLERAEAIESYLSVSV